MYYKRKKIIQLTTFVILILVLNIKIDRDYYSFEYLTINDKDLNRNENKLNENPFLKTTSFSSIDYCEKSQEWEILDDDIFFRRDASYYFNDQEYVLLHIIANKDPNLNLQFIVYVLLNDIIVAKVLIKNFKFYKYEVFGNDGFYNLFEVKSYFKLNSILEKFNILPEIDKINLEVKIKYNSQITKVPIKLKIKNIKSKQISKNQQSMICSKIYQLKNDDYKTMKWWFEINKKIGFNKIVIYNNSIQNSKKFQDLFSYYENFVQVRQIQCFPNLFESKYQKTFLRNLNEFKLKYEQRWLFEVLLFNECYLDNIDIYQYISILDQDEIVLPRNLNDFYRPSQIGNQIFDDKNIFEKNNDCQLNNFQSYITSLVDNLYSSQKYSLHFKMGYYLKLTEVDIIFKQFENYLNSDLIEDKIHVVGKVTNYTFQILNNDEKDYVVYLNKVYKNVTRFLYEDHVHLKQFPEIFARLFFIYGESVSYKQGKTFHSTEVANHVSHHSSYHFSQNAVPYQLGHVAHFQNIYNFSSTTISIKDLVFDLNYFKCYFLESYKMLF